jgi:hypothetical protein
MVEMTYSNPCFGNMFIPNEEIPTSRRFVYILNVFYYLLEEKMDIGASQQLFVVEWLRLSSIKGRELSFAR